MNDSGKAGEWESREIAYRHEQDLQREAEARERGLPWWKRWLARIL